MKSALSQRDAAVRDLRAETARDCTPSLWLSIDMLEAEQQQPTRR